MRVIFGKPGSKSLLTDRRRPKIVKNDVSRETSEIYIKIEKATLFCEIKWLLFVVRYVSRETIIVLQALRGFSKET